MNNLPNVSPKVIETISITDVSLYKLEMVRVFSLQEVGFLDSTWIEIIEGI